MWKKSPISLSALSGSSFSQYSVNMNCLVIDTGNIMGNIAVKWEVDYYLFSSDIFNLFFVSSTILSY